MHRANSLHWRGPLVIALVLLLTTVASSFLTVKALHAQESPDPVVLPSQEAPVFTTDLAAEMIYREALLIQFVNERRHTAGLLPLRWNRELSDSARWFANDSVETKISCGHTDSLSRMPGTRIRAFGYTQPSTYGELVVCGFTEPKAAVAAWMANSMQRSLLLDPNLREAGAGYYYSIEKGRGYIVLDLSADPNFAPMLINNEALVTQSNEVTVTVHPQNIPAVEMKVSDSPSFEGVDWEPYVSERHFLLDGSDGWHWVYVLTRDAVGRTSLLSDVIYAGTTVPKEEISLEYATNIGPGFAISGLKAPSNALLRLSLGWLVDSSDPSFTVLQGPALAVDDPDALGGSAMLMISGGLDGLARATISDLPTDRILTAYVRVKSPMAGGDAPIGELRVRVGDQTVNALTMTSGDFAVADEYQEFALDFAIGASSNSTVVQAELVRNGEVDLTVDVVRFFGRAVPVEQASSWSAGSSYYRSRGVIGRWQTEEGLGEPFDVAVATVDSSSMQSGTPAALTPSTSRIEFTSYSGTLSAYAATVYVCSPGCSGVKWQASTESPWLAVTAVGDGLVVMPKVEGLQRGPYIGLVQLTPVSGPAGVSVAPASFYVQLVVDYPDPTPDPVDPTEPPPPPPATLLHAYIPTASR
jgi:uncharacterized protein YkwD